MQSKTKMLAKKTSNVILTSLFLLYSLMPITKVQSATTQKIELEGPKGFKMIATDINKIEGQGRQVIMELWGYDIEFFKRI